MRSSGLSFGMFLAVSPETVGRGGLEGGGKILLPQFVLDRILKQGLDQGGVMMFWVENPTTKQNIAVGVESFTADSASVVVPMWMLESIDVFETDKVQVSLAKLPSAKSVIFQPFTGAFNKLANPRAILEHTLRQLPCLTQGSVVPIDFNNKIYKLKILKTEPERAVSIIHADVVTDFARPLSDFTHSWGEEEEVKEHIKHKKEKFQGHARTVKDG